MSDHEDEREQMTQEEWEETQKALQEHLRDVEKRFWESVRIRPEKPEPQK